MRTGRGKLYSRAMTLSQRRFQNDFNDRVTWSFPKEAHS